MARTTRQTVVFGVEDWKRIYQTYREADFQSYDFEALRKSFVDYLRQYYPETFNDYIESSEFIAMLDVIAFMGQALAFRNDLNTRENYIDTAERRDSVVRLANLVAYTPKRNTESQGYLKVFSVQTTENVTDFNGIDLANITVIGMIQPTLTGPNNSQPLSMLLSWIHNEWVAQAIDKQSWVWTLLNTVSTWCQGFCLYYHTLPQWME
jgi:hypothetical protein